MSKSAEQFFDEAGGTGHDPIKWGDYKVGDVVSGTIIDEPRSVTRENLNTRQPEDQLPINLDTADGPRTLWVRQGFLAGAIKDACKEVGHGLAKGGKLSVKYTEDRDVNKPQPARIFKAKYEAPAAAEVDVSEIF